MKNDQVYCQTSIERSDIDQFIILGDAFLESFYTYINLDQKKIAFAHSINDRSLNELTLVSNNISLKIQE